MGDLAKKISTFTNLHQHIQEWIGRQCVIENKARLLIATALRKNHYESDMEIIKLIDISFLIAAQEAAQAVGDDWGDAQKNIGLTDKRVLQQLQRRFEGNVKSLAKKQFRSRPATNFSQRIGYRCGDKVPATILSVQNCFGTIWAVEQR
jgi:hypothetical protein